MGVLAILGDILWILALSIMAGASRVAWAKIGKGIPVPMIWSPAGKTLWRAPRLVALTLLPTAAFLLSLYLLAISREPVSLTFAVILLGVRATVASVLAMIHLAQVRRGLNQLGAEGRIRF
jgi:hypothetical protein